LIETKTSAGETIIYPAVIASNTGIHFFIVALEFPPPSGIFLLLI
jgi:hypothetical protein